jgi:hypothetical protein
VSPSLPAGLGCRSSRHRRRLSGTTQRHRRRRAVDAAGVRARLACLRDLVSGPRCRPAPGAPNDGAALARRPGGVLLRGLDRRAATVHHRSDASRARLHATDPDPRGADRVASGAAPHRWCGSQGRPHHHRPPPRDGRHLPTDTSRATRPCAPHRRLRCRAPALRMGTRQRDCLQAPPLRRDGIHIRPQPSRRPPRRVGYGFPCTMRASGPG